MRYPCACASLCTVHTPCGACGAACMWSRLCRHGRSGLLLDCWFVVDLLGACLPVDVHWQLRVHAVRMWCAVFSSASGVGQSAYLRTYIP